MNEVMHLTDAEGVALWQMLPRKYSREWGPILTQASRSRIFPITKEEALQLFPLLDVSKNHRLANRFLGAICQQFRVHWAAQERKFYW